MSLKLDPKFDVSFPCPQCSFIARGPGQLEEHLATHETTDSESVVAPHSLGAVSVNEAGPEEVKAVSPPRVYTCSECGQKITGFDKFNAHKKEHRSTERLETHKE